MNNQLFLLQSPQQRENKLSDIIRCRTNDALTECELQALINSASNVFQHSIFVHSSPQGFCDALTLERLDSRSDWGKVIFGPVSFGSKTENGCSPGALYGIQNPAAVIIKSRSAPDAQPTSTIHIYVPARLYAERKTHHEQREETPHCV